jgi:hypothetical protein
MILGLSKGCRGAPFIILADSNFIFPLELTSCFENLAIFAHV